MPPAASVARRCLTVLCFALLLAACAPTVERDAQSARPRAVVMMIGDGLGPSQVALARYAVHGPGGRFAFEGLPVTALVSTWSSSNAVTDSGAAATAFAAGVKTDNRYVGMDAAGQPAKSIAAVAKEQGWKVGYVTSTTITHATPAAFYAHVPDRYADEEQIAVQLLEQGPDVAIGGGYSIFLPESEGGRRRDGRNLLTEAEQAGYTVWGRGQDLDATPPERLLGLFANSHFYFTLDDLQFPPERRDPSLARLTRLALDALSRQGASFFLLVEGGRIDHAAHGFDAAGVAAETAAFDEAVAAVLEFQQAHPETLVVLTADHATGGLAINDTVDWPGLERQRASVAAMASKVRNAGADAAYLAEMTGYEGWTEEEVAAIRDQPDSYEAERTLGRLLGERNGVTWLPRINVDNTKGHTGEDVPLYAGGPGAERFQGVIDNTDIPKTIADLLGWQLPTGPPAVGQPAG